MKKGDSGKRYSDITGTIEGVYDELGPQTVVSVHSQKKGVYSFDASEFPWPRAITESLIGRKVRIKTVFDVEVLE